LGNEAIKLKPKVPAQNKKMLPIELGQTVSKDREHKSAVVKMMKWIEIKLWQAYL